MKLWRNPIRYQPGEKGIVLDLLLVVSLLASTASQLRLGETSMGLGEIGLAVWLLINIILATLRLEEPLTPAAIRLLGFWSVFALAMCFGTMAGYATGDVHDPVWFRHDIVAYIFVAALSCFATIALTRQSRTRQAAWLLATCGGAWLVVQVACSFLLAQTESLNLWEWDRLRGFSDNSNQLALVCVIIGNLSLYLAETSERGKKILALLCLAAAVIAGRMTKSDAFLLVLIAGSAVYVALKFRSSIFLSTAKISLRSTAAMILALSTPLILVHLALSGGTIATQAQLTVKEMSRGGGGADTDESANLRLEIWKQAIVRGASSWTLGLGPGPHLEIPPSIVEGRQQPSSEPDNVVHPAVNFTPNFEAHNTFLDLFVQGGFLATTAFIWLLGSTGLAAYRAGLDSLTTFLCGLAVFGAFHFVVRHPIVWFAIAVCLNEAFNPRQRGYLTRYNASVQSRKEASLIEANGQSDAC